MNSTDSAPSGAYNDNQWSGPINVASVDLMAMVVSDAGLASTEPEWWNSSPIACLLIAVQPRGGWQVLQRGVQWGTDHWARAFGVSCKMPVLYCYFACSMRNRLEVWDSKYFASPMEGIETMIETEGDETNLAQNASVKKRVDDVEALQIVSALSESSDDIVQDSMDTKPSPEQIEKQSDDEKPKVKTERARGDTSWKVFQQYNGGTFAVQRPTKLTDGSRGGQAFMCELLIPAQGNAYSIEEQARLQFLSIVLVAASLMRDNKYGTFRHVMQEDFELGTRVGIVFKRLVRGLLVANFFVIGFIISVFYALWGRNIYGSSTPYVIQLCSLTTWTFGAAGVLMLGGNPRVEIDDGKSIPKHILSRIESLPSEYAKLQFGSLHGSIYTLDRGSCYIHRDTIMAVCGWNLRLKRKLGWGTAIMWFACHMGTSVALQVAGSKVATVYSQIMGICVLVITSVVRGAGVSGPEEWMIPRWKMRKNARYAVNLQGQIMSRAK